MKRKMLRSVGVSMTAVPLCVKQYGYFERLKLLVKMCFKFFFNVKQLDKQKEMRKQRATLIGNITLIFLPLVMAFKYLKEFFQNRRGIYKKHVYRNWVKRRDPVSR